MCARDISLLIEHKRLHWRRPQYEGTREVYGIWLKLYLEPGTDRLGNKSQECQSGGGEGANREPIFNSKAIPII